MRAKILQEAGYEHALQGLAYSYYDRQNDFRGWWTEERGVRASPW